MDKNNVIVETPTQTDTKPTYIEEISGTENLTDLQASILEPLARMLFRLIRSEIGEQK